MNILLLDGSPAKPSHTNATLCLLTELFQENGHTCETISLLDFNMPANDPIYHADAMQSPAQKVKDLATNAKSKAKEKAKKDTFEAEPELSSQIMKQD